KRDKSPLLSRKQMAHVNAIDGLTEKVYSPLQHLEEKLHSWVAFFIMPIFALANAGVAFGIDMHLDWPLVIHISIALILGKSIGISLLSYIGIKLKIAKLPEGTNMMQILAISVLAGVGFTMSIFIANLAFESNAIYIDSAKIGVILGSLVSGILAYFLLLYSSPKSKSKKS
ncbi:MAG: NhaA family Na+:H+ antiporter, partial [Flavobacteriales bacterium]